MTLSDYLTISMVVFAILIGKLWGQAFAVVYCLWKYGPPDDESIIPVWMNWYYRWWLNRG